MNDFIDPRDKRALQLALLVTVLSLAAMQLTMLANDRRASAQRPPAAAAPAQPQASGLLAGSKPERVAVAVPPQIPRAQAQATTRDEVKAGLESEPCAWGNCPRSIVDYCAGDICDGEFFDGEVAASTELIPLVAVAPVYPAAARRDHIEGWVDVQITIGPDSTVVKARAKDAKPRGVFESAAVMAAFRSRFRPRIVDGQAVETSGVRRYNFSLPESEQQLRERIQGLPALPSR